MSYILVLNAGSSSLKFRLYEMPSEELVLKGLAERIGEEGSRIKINNEIENIPLPGHATALEQLKTYLSNRFPEYMEKLTAVGHRVVHGGETFVRPTLITPEVKAKIRSLFDLAPLHNPPNLTGIEAAEKYFPGVPQVAVFDTAFHQSIPEVEHRYAIPGRFYEEGIRQYGFHGISHEYVSRKAMAKLNNPGAKIISLHLGNGASMAAVDAGKSVATTMGFGPLSGLIMGTRSGDIDPSVIFYLIENQGYDPDEVKRILNKESGMKALAGSNDMRDVEQDYAKHDPRAVLALEMYARRIKKYMGSYYALLEGLDALVFTAGIGENSPLVREMALKGLAHMGILLDKRKNKEPQSYGGEIQAENSRVKIFVFPTNEELAIAQKTYKLLYD